MQTVYINARFLSQKMTGQQRFSRELVDALDRWLDRDAAARAAWRFELLAPRGASAPPGLRHIPLRTVGRLQGHAWEQLELPVHAFGGALLSLCGVGPVAHPRHFVAIHDAAPFANPANFTRAFRMLYSVLVPTLARTASRVLTVSEFSKGELVRYCGLRPEKLVVVPNGADHILGAASDPSVLDTYGLVGKRYVFAVGSISVNKNFAAVVDAFGRLDRPDLTLVVAGGQNSSVFANCDIRDSVDLVRLGYVSDGALRALYENAMCFVLPSLYEGFGIPPLEAMLCGCPVIVSTAPALVETCADAALTCDPHRPETLAQRIAEIADDGALREQLRTRGFARARQFGWDASAQRLVDLLAGCGGRQRVSALGQTA